MVSNSTVNALQCVVYFDLESFKITKDHLGLLSLNCAIQYNVPRSKSTKAYVKEFCEVVNVCCTELFVNAWLL